MLAIAKKKRKIGKNHETAMRHLIERTKLKYADDVTPKAALNYLENYYGNGNGKTYNNVKSCSNLIFRCCLIEANMQNSPFEPIINKQVENVDTHRNLTDAEIDKVMEVLPEHIQVMTMLSRWTAQRLETCARMTPEMFDFERKVFIIKPSKTARFNKYVCCPILPKLEKFIKPVLQKIPDKTLPIVGQMSDMTNQKISKWFKYYLNKCEIKDDDSGKAGFHSLRGSAITYFKEIGMKSDDLRLITGHTTDEMEAIYDRSSEQISRFAKGQQD
jgi:integrase